MGLSLKPLASPASTQSPCKRSCCELTGECLEPHSAHLDPTELARLQGGGYQDLPCLPSQGRGKREEAVEISWEPCSLNWPFGPREGFLSLNLPICKMGQQFLSLEVLLGSKEALARKWLDHPSGSLMTRGMGKTPVPVGAHSPVNLHFLF